ncbi:hypothetical protein EDB89DRAFT_814587 [Lactarius sanguifluus]|nr:hypothetical protein EDB89DRAFT_814587 [Lactarius sanguifluus]
MLMRCLCLYVIDRFYWDVRGISSSSSVSILRPTPRHWAFPCVYSLVSFFTFYCDSLFVSHQQSRIATPIRPYFSTVIDFSSCLLVICGSVRISYRLRPLLHQPRSLGCEEFILLPLRIFNYGLAVIGVRHLTSRLCGVISSVIFRVVCRLRHQLSCRHFFDLFRSSPPLYPTSGHLRQRRYTGLATFYGIMPLVSRVG